MQGTKGERRALMVAAEETLLPQILGAEYVLRTSQEGVLFHLPP